MDEFHDLLCIAYNLLIYNGFFSFSHAGEIGLEPGITMLGPSMGGILALSTKDRRNQKKKQGMMPCSYVESMRISLGPAL